MGIYEYCQKLHFRKKLEKLSFKLKAVRVHTSTLYKVLNHHLFHKAFFETIRI